ncbi:C-type lectin 37Db [Ceratitis capitata]|uniref:C-type lectin 37Db n=1 Tax=Ceratitis capitata TaxID=7213 RepID=UPI0003297E4D|nr:C-type lectin 37Db [Ceratitis capitata]
MKQFNGKLVILCVALLGICEATPLVEDKEFSFGGWPGSLDDNTDYYVSSKKVSWFAANYYCFSKGWELVSPENFQALTLLKGFRELYDVTGTTYWSAGNRLDGSSWVWGLNDGGSKFSITNWSSNEPNGNYTDKCLLIDNSAESLWTNADCAAKYKFICQKYKATTKTAKCKESIF